MSRFGYAARVRAATLDFHRSRIAKVQRQIAQNLDAPLDLLALAKIAHLSPRQLERVFTRTIGETPAGHARRLRLERAAVRLRTTHSNILTLAIEAGLESHEAFTRGFRARFGNTPAEYRRVANATLQPRPRAGLWQLVAATLRQHVEGEPAQCPLGAGKRRSHCQSAEHRARCIIGKFPAPKFARAGEERPVN